MINPTKDLPNIHVGLLSGVLTDTLASWIATQVVSMYISQLIPVKLSATCHQRWHAFSVPAVMTRTRDAPNREERIPAIHYTPSSHGNISKTISSLRLSPMAKIVCVTIMFCGYAQNYTQNGLRYRLTRLGSVHCIGLLTKCNALRCDYLVLVMQRYRQCLLSSSIILDKTESLFVSRSRNF